MNLRRILRIARKDFGEQLRNWRILFYGLYLLIWFGVIFLIRWSGIFPLVIVLSAPERSALTEIVTDMKADIPFFVDVVLAEGADVLPDMMQEMEADLGVIGDETFDIALGEKPCHSIVFIYGIEHLLCCNGTKKRSPEDKFSLIQLISLRRNTPKLIRV